MATPPDNATLEIKKYPNRRFYDVSRSRHVSMADLYELVRAGRLIRVTDSRTGADITNVVLTQIILEHDPPKLDLFPASLLHQAIQANQQMVRSFVEQYLARAMDAFVASRRQFDEFLRQAGFSALQPTAPFDWVRMLMPGLGAGPPAGSAGTPPPPRDDLGDVRAELDRLRAELRRLQRPAEGRRKKRRGRASS
jgi:polyhydroxyalkanoate synthesis repressor PhaR